MPRARTVLKVVLGCAAVLTLLAIGGAFYSLHHIRTMFRNTGTRTHTAITAHREAFLEDQRFLAGLPIFAPRPGGRDAGPLIGPRVRWLLVKAPADALALNQRVLEVAAVAGWKPGPVDWAGVDFSWMAQLAGYDVWDVDRNGQEPDPKFGTDPEPDGRDLSAWAKLRIAKGVHDRAAPAALQEVQELARLCFTTERFTTQLDGVMLLSRLREERERLGMAPDPRLDRDTVRRLHRALFGAGAFARLETPPVYEPDFTRLAVGRCAALHDGAHLALVVRPALRTARRADYERLERLLAAVPECRLRRLRERWALPDDPALSKRSIWWEWLPGGRSASAEILVAIGEQDWFKQYPPVQAPE